MGTSRLLGITLISDKLVVPNIYKGLCAAFYIFCGGGGGGKVGLNTPVHLCSDSLLLVVANWKGGGGVFNKVLYREALPLGSDPYPLIY